MAVDSKSKKNEDIELDDEVGEIDPKDKKKRERLEKKEAKEQERLRKKEEKDAKKRDKKGDNEPDKELSNKKRGKKDKKEKAKGGIGKILSRLFLLLLIAAVIGIFVFNPLNIRDRYIYGVLGNIPIVQNVIPGAGENIGNEPEPVPTELNARIAGLEETIAQLQEENQSLRSRNETLVNEMTGLQAQATQWGDFKAERDAFDRDVALQNPSEYIKYYESISQTNLEQLYQEAEDTLQRTKDFKKYIATFQSMDEGDAAVILENLLTTNDMDLVVTILRNLDSEHSGAILAEMDPTNSASVARRMAPQEP